MWNPLIRIPHESATQHSSAVIQCVGSRVGVLQLQTKRSRKLVLLSSKGVLLVRGFPRSYNTLRAPFLFLSWGRFFYSNGAALFFPPLKPLFFNPADSFLFLLITPRFFKSTSTYISSFLFSPQLKSVHFSFILNLFRSKFIHSCLIFFPRLI